MSRKTRLTTRTLTSTIFSNFSNQKHIPTPTQSHYSYITIIRSTQYPLIVLPLSLINRLTRIKLIQPTPPNLPLSAIINRATIDISYKLHASHGFYCFLRIVCFLQWNCECLGRFENVKIQVTTYVSTLVLTTGSIFLLTPSPAQCPADRKSTRTNFANRTTFLLDTSP